MKGVGEIGLVPDGRVPSPLRSTTYDGQWRNSTADVGGRRGADRLIEARVQ